MSASRLAELLRKANAEKAPPARVAGETLRIPIVDELQQEAFGRKGVGYRLDKLIASLDRLAAIARSGPTMFSEGPDNVPGVKAHFLAPSEEDTRTWGNSTTLSFVGASIGEAFVFPSTQLLHVSRKRPTTFLVTTIVILGNGWAGEGVGWNLFNTIIVGVGQTQAPVQRVLPLDPLIASLPLTAGRIAQVVDFVEVPANALQCNVALSDTLGIPVNPGPHDVLVTVLAAPIYA
jgi:hypothetical protein